MCTARTYRPCTALVPPACTACTAPPQGLRILDYCCDTALDEPGRPLDLWGVAEREAISRGTVQLEARLHLRLRHAVIRLRRMGPLGRLLSRPVTWLSSVS